MPKEIMIDVKCSVCMKDMQMPKSFLEKVKGKVTNPNSMPHICSDCTEKGDFLGEKKMKNFMKDVKKQMNKLGKNNELAEELAEEITNGNIEALLDELDNGDASEKEKITEAFFRGSWLTLFMIANNHEPGFLEEEATAVRDFHEKMKEREKTKS